MTLLSTLLAARAHDGDLTLLFILVALGLFIAAGVAAWRRALVVAGALALIAVLILIFYTG